MIETIKPDAFAKLRRNNLVASIIYFLLGGFIFIGSFTILAVKNFKPDIYINIIKVTRFLNPTRYQLANSVQEFIADVPLMLILGSVLLVSAVIHFIVVTNKINPEYNNSLQKGVNKLKWVDGIFSSVIIALIPIIAGVNDFSILVLLFLGSITFNFLAMSMEQANAKGGKKIWSPYIAMVLIFLASIAVLAFPILKSIEAIPLVIEQYPSWPLGELQIMNYIILGVYFAFMFIKLIQIFLQNKKVGKWKSTTFNENVYIVLNLITKIAVIGLVFYSIVNKLISEIYVNLI